jgi:hypothetical protein
MSFLLSFILILTSYGQALVYPGEASFSVRSVTWLRDHGGSSLVDAVENWWYTRDPPPKSTHEPTFGTPFATGPGTPAPLPALRPHPAPWEGRWRADPPMTPGVPAVFTTYLRPDPDYPGVLAGVARFDPSVVKAQLIAGTREPSTRSPQQWPEGGQVPPTERAGLVATFNSGFKMAGAHGGYFAQDRMVRSLHTGAASLVIDRTGRVSVDKWGRDRRMGPDVAAVRQNLELIVDNGAVVPGLDVNTDDRWGSAKNQLQYTWRSAVGVDAGGNLFYVAGDKLNLATLARTLADTGAVRDMELDIHPQEVHLFTYRHRPGGPQPMPSALLGTMRGPRDRYLQPDQRDFLGITLR